MTMMVVDSERSERGPQRKKATDGRLLHCCCVCGKLDTWGDSWSCFASYKDMDDGYPYPKFCSDTCADKAGTAAENITLEMKRKAKDAEWREPNTVWRPATHREKYNAAAYDQRRHRTPRD